MQRHEDTTVDLAERMHKLTDASEVALPPGLQEALEELSVAEEELRQQNDELLAARQRAEDERQRYVELFEFAPEPYVVTDANGTIREVNRATAELLGVSQPVLVGKPMATFVALDDRTAFRAIVTDALRQGRVDDRTVRITPRGSATRFVSSNVAVAAGLPPTLRWVLRDVSDRVRHERELRRLTNELDQRVAARTRQLEHAIAAKDEFLGMVSHELRTPITTILGNAEVLRRRIEQLSGEDRMSAVADIETESGRLLRLIDDLLLLAKIESHDRELEPLLVDRIAQRVASACERAYHRRVDVTAAADLPAALGDMTYLEQVLRNLIGNAAKYTPEGTVIEILIAHNSEHVTVSVGDRGPGIPDDEMDKVFEAFYRARGSSERTTGQGLGLAVALRLVQAQGGDMWAARRVGGGTEFVFTLLLDAEWS